MIERWIAEENDQIKRKWLRTPGKWIKTEETRPNRFGAGTKSGRRAKNGELLQWLEETSRYEGDECRVWPFTALSSGYGLFRYEGRNVNPSRWMCKRAHGEPPKDKPYALHAVHCTSRLCCTKRHLRWGTAKENSADMVKAGTAPWL